jgi:hypothetical protein
MVISGRHRVAATALDEHSESDMMPSASDASAGVQRIGPLLACFVALWLLNALLTFHNVWPTLAVRPSRELSLDLAIILLLLVIWRWIRGPVPRRFIVLLAVLFVLGAIGRYAEVTSFSLYGREVNLYWDLPHTAALTGMVTRVASPLLLIVSIVGVIGGVALLYGLALWSWLRINDALKSRLFSIGISVTALAVIVGFTLENIAPERPRIPRFAMPISKTYAEQFAKVGAAVLENGAIRQLPPSPALSTTLSVIKGSDVTIVFVESYGRTAYDRREFLDALAPSRAELVTAVNDTGRSVVSGYVRSPTFGGGSWLAHLSFLSGIEVRDASRAQLLMTQSRRTFGNALAEHGYRRVGLMPGLKLDWPEGIFYGFDRIYDDAALGYHGPAFGWWRIPDQFSLAKLDELELAERTSTQGTRIPRFTFFPTISTHTPFRPTPPYQTDWSKIVSSEPFDAASLQESLSQLPQWNNLAPAYTDSLIYTLQTLAGYLRIRSDDSILVVVGDHQPPAMVSGPNAPWDVPVHVISSNPALIQALRGCGFVSGITPSPETMGEMHQLGPTLLYAFDTSDSKTACPMRQSGSALSPDIKERT